jgi:hypothetical protein
MTIGEGLALNSLAAWILGTPEASGPVSDDDAKHHLMMLAERAYKALEAGLTPEIVAARWEDRRRYTQDEWDAERADWIATARGD